MADLSIIEIMEKENITLSRARYNFLMAKAAKDHEESKLIHAAPGKNTSEKTVNAKSQEAWLALHRDLARLESLYEHYKLRMKILNNKWLEEYQERKENEGLIRKQGDS